MINIDHRHTVANHPIIDTFRLLNAVAVLGPGIRLFNDRSDPVDLALADSHAFANGVISLTCRAYGAMA